MCYRFTRLVLVSALSSVVVLGCSGQSMLEDHEQSIHNMQSMVKQAKIEDAARSKLMTQALPDVVSSALENSKDESSNHARFDIGVNKMPVRAFFTHLASLDKTNIIVSPKVKGQVTLHLRQVTLPDVLNAVSESYNFLIEKKSYGYKVVQQHFTTQIYSIDWLALSRSGSSSMNINDVQGSLSQNSASSSDSDTTTTSTTTDTSTASSDVKTSFGVENYWEEITSAITQIIQADGTVKGSGKSSVTVNKANGLLVVRATPAQQKLVKKYLHSLHNVNSKQVVIDARILEVNLTKDQKVGVSELGIPFLKWTNSGTTSTLTYANSKSGTITNLKDFNNIINTLSTVGHVSILSSPRVSILNNQKALIKVGEDEYYSLGGTTTYLSSSSGNVDPIESNNLQSFFSGVALDVTPQVDSHNKITMHIHPIVSSVSTVQTQVNGSTLDLPKTKIRETDTIVRSKSGEIIVIGGLISEGSDLIHNKVPGYEKHAFNSLRNDSYYKKELFILLRARLVNEKSWVKELDEVSHYLDHSEDAADDVSS